MQGLHYAANAVVSIHAPVWVRRDKADRLLQIEQFQFTHPCGCDSFHIPKPHPGRGFNSRTRVGATILISTFSLGYMVSIHAPVWVRLGYRYRYYDFMKFQFTHPCGCDSFAGFSSFYSKSFNSRTRVGATLEFITPCPPVPVSIHAPVWVRHQYCPLLTNGVLFQFTHPCGCDVVVVVVADKLVSFNSRTRVGATPH